MGELAMRRSIVDRFLQRYAAIAAILGVPLSILGWMHMLQQDAAESILVIEQTRREKEIRSDGSRIEVEETMRFVIHAEAQRENLERIRDKVTIEEYLAIASKRTDSATIAARR
jgi:hypothetical protein